MTVSGTGAEASWTGESSPVSMSPYRLQPDPLTISRARWRRWRDGHGRRILCTAVDSCAFFDFLVAHRKGRGVAEPSRVDVGKRFLPPSGVPASSRFTKCLKPNCLRSLSALHSNPECLACQPTPGRQKESIEVNSSTGYRAGRQASMRYLKNRIPPIIEGSN